MLPVENIGCQKAFEIKVSRCSAKLTLLCFPASTLLHVLTLTKLNLNYGSFSKFKYLILKQYKFIYKKENLYKDLPNISFRLK